LGNDGQYFKLDSVELVEATPSTTRGESLEELAHDHIIETI